MEVRGTVIVNEDTGDSQFKGGFADLGRKLKPHEEDSVPRILVKGFRKNTKPFKLHSVFSNFGTVTYLAVKDQQAVIEFSSRASVDEILQCKFLKIQGAQVECQKLLRFLHVEENQLQVDLHPDLMQLDGKEAFDEFLDKVSKDSSNWCSDEWKTICNTIETVARNAYPRCKVYPFGSRISLLGLHGCDLDIFLDCGNMYHGNDSLHPRDQQIMGETVLKQMLRCEDFTRFHKVFNARVPILKFFHKPTGTYGDIAFRNGLGVENTKLLNFLQSLDNRIRPIFLFVKTWARHQNLRVVTENFHFTSYSLIMMAVYYLQQLQNPVLPPIYKLMKLFQGERQVIEGWPCSFIQDKKAIPKTKNNSSVLELTKGFFFYYKLFHFEWKVISPYLGKAIERRDIDELPSSCKGDMAPLFSTYLEKLQEEGERFLTRPPVCIQDPFEHSHNLTRNVREEVVMNFISSCGLMYEKLCAFS